MIPCVIVIQNNVVDRNILCKDGKHAEEVFIHLLKNTPEFKTFNQQDIDDILSGGFYELENGSICLSWAMTEKEILGDICL